VPSVNGDGNLLLTDDVIAKEALRLLKNNLVLAPLVYRNMESTFAKVGDTISLKKPFRTKTASGRTLVKQPMVDQTIPFAIDRQEHFGLEVTVRDRTLSLEQFSERYLKSGIVQIANVVDRSIALVLKTAFFSSGTPGTANVIKDYLYAEAYQSNVAVPEDGMRRAVCNTLDAAEISDEVIGKFNPELVKGSIQKGYMGPIAGYDMYKTQNVYNHTVGDHGGTPLADGVTAQTGASILTNGWTNDTTGILLAGDVITFAGVYEINPQNYTSTGRLQNFVVTADVDSGATTGPATILISPSINDGTLTGVDGEGASISLAAYQNVTAAVANDAAITVIGTANTTYRQNYLFHRDAIGLAVPELELPQSATVKSRVSDPDSGLSLSMTGAYDITNQSEITRIDVIWGVHDIYPELMHRLWSDEA
jgi:hypothetical protein